MRKWDRNNVKLHNFIIFRWSKDKLGLQLWPRLQKAKGLSQKNVKSITFTFVSQFGATFEIKFLIVYWDCWLTLVFQKKAVFLKIRHLENRFFRCQQATHVSWAYVHLLWSFGSGDHITYFPYWKQNENKTYQALATLVQAAIMAHTHTIGTSCHTLRNGGSSIFPENEQKSYFFHPRFQANKWIFLEKFKCYMFFYDN